MQRRPTCSSSPRRWKEPTRWGPIADWLLEWKWDGIRLQLIRRAGDIAPWSRGEERLDGRFPEIEAALAIAAGCRARWRAAGWRDGDAPLPFTALQTHPAPQARREDACPTRRCACSPTTSWNSDGEDLRARGRWPSAARCWRPARRAWRSAHRGVAAGGGRHLADAARLRGQSRGVEGLMLKRRAAPYQHRRKRGDWWKWKIDPVDHRRGAAVCAGRPRRRSTLYTDYTFGLWDGDALVPVAKAYSGLDDREILKLDAGSARTPPNVSGRCGRSPTSRCSSSASKPVNRSSATSRASRCASRASCAGATTSPCRKRTASTP